MDSTKLLTLSNEELTLFARKYFVPNNSKLKFPMLDDLELKKDKLDHSLNANFYFKDEFRNRYMVANSMIRLKGKNANLDWINVNRNIQGFGLSSYIMAAGSHMLSDIEVKKLSIQMPQGQGRFTWAKKVFGYKFTDSSKKIIADSGIVFLELMRDKNWSKIHQYINPENGDTFQYAFDGFRQDSNGKFPRTPRDWLNRLISEYRNNSFQPGDSRPNLEIIAGDVKGNELSEMNKLISNIIKKF